MLVFIPYYKKGAQGHELELSVKGWHRHCRSDFRIVVVGEEAPDFSGGYEFLYSKRVEPIEGSYLPHLDYVSCIRKMREHYPDEEGFVFTADDNYAVMDFDESWIRRLRYLTDIPFEGAVDGWPIEKFFTRCKMQDLGLPLRNWTTHIPCWFNFDKVLAMFDRFDMDHESFVLEDMYFNLYHAGDEAELDTPYKFMLSRKEDVLDLDAAIRQRMWICNAPTGWSVEMEEKLMYHYGQY